MSDRAPADPAEPVPPVSDRAERELAQQRSDHRPGADLPEHEVNDEGVGALINNTGLDGEAASG